MNTRSTAGRAALWVKAVRAYSYPASIVPVVLGAVFAWYGTGRFDPFLFALTLVAGVLYHTGANLINDYYDHRHRVDRPGTLGGSGVLVAHDLAPRQVLLGAWVALGLGTGIGLWLVTLFGWPLLAVGLAGLAGAVFYTATPGSAKYHALGEPLVFVMMGVLMVLGAYLVQAGEPSWKAVWVSLPVSFLVTAILQANDTRDIVDDRAAGITTLAILLGHERARDVYSGLLAATYLSTLALALARVTPWLSLVSFATLPLAWKLHRHYRRHRTEQGRGLVGTIERTAQLHLLFGLLLSAGIVAGGFLR